MTRSISALGILGVGLFLAVLGHNPDLWEPTVSPNYHECCGLGFGWLCVALDMWMQHRD